MSAEEESVLSENDEQSLEESTTRPSSSIPLPRLPQKSLPAGPSFIPPPLPKVDRAALFPVDSAEYNIISKAFADAATYKSNIVSLSALCERLKIESIQKDKLMMEKDVLIAELSSRVYDLEEQIVQYDAKLEESIRLLKDNRKDTAFLRGSILDKDQYIEKSISIKKEHGLEIPSEISIYSSGPSSAESLNPVIKEEINSRSSSDNESVQESVPTTKKQNSKKSYQKSEVVSKKSATTAKNLKRKMKTTETDVDNNPKKAKVEIPGMSGATFEIDVGLLKEIMRELTGNSI